MQWFKNNRKNVYIYSDGSVDDIKRLQVISMLVPPLQTVEVQLTEACEILLQRGCPRFEFLAPVGAEFRDDNFTDITRCPLCFQL